MQRFVTRRPLAFSAGLTLFFAALTLAVLGAVRLFAPGLSLANLDLPLLLVQTVIALSLIQWLG